MIEANAETDLRIAKACGMDADYFPRHGGGRICMLKERRTFHPTTDMNDAMEAAKAVGLFEFDLDNNVAECLWKTRHGKWAMSDSDFADTPELAICEAIEATAKGGG